MPDTMIAAHDLGKQYRLGGQRETYTALRDVLAQAVGDAFNRAKSRNAAARPPAELFWALQDLSFEVARGEVVGIIGRNGAGKSTLLKILSRITEPTCGHVDVYGRVGSLLEVGTGFHPELTGRENIFLNGAILGMPKRDIAAKMDAIVSFAEIEKFLDTPVKRYSSGMYMRLAFAVAAHLEPEVLVIDEVLAVGDVAFQQKCLGKMDEVSRAGRTVLFVSHNMAAVTHLCSRVCWLEAGTLREEGPAAEIVGKYLRQTSAQAEYSLRHRTDRSGSGRIRLTDILFKDREGHAVDVVAAGDDVSIGLRYESDRPDELGFVEAHVKVTDQLGSPVFWCRNDIVGRDLRHLPPRGMLECRIPRLPLVPGRYSIEVAVAVEGKSADKVHDAAVLSVTDGDYYGTGKLPPSSVGSMLVDYDWHAGASAGAVA